LNLNEKYSSSKTEVKTAIASNSSPTDIETEVKNLSLEELMKELSSKVD